MLRRELTDPDSRRVEPYASGCATNVQQVRGTWLWRNQDDMFYLCGKPAC
jgi:hypothetical protein